LHETIDRPVCKFFISPAGCRRGDACTFKHKVTKEVKRPKPVQLKPASAAPPVAQPVPATRPSENPVNQLWGFESENENYFYGTVGAIETQPYPRQYADALGYAHSEKVELKSTKQTTEYAPVVCPFFLYGSCVYGSNCKNIHTLDGILEQNEFENILMNEEIEAARRADCGICLCPVEDKSLGMLTNCWCTFCLECIRSWRKEGSSFAKTSHVRSVNTSILSSLIPALILRLCPLCRTESYFIIPCNRLIRDVTRKTQLVDEYKKSLSRIPCRVSGLTLLASLTLPSTLTAPALSNKLLSIWDLLFL
jgi:hypothetical protein